MDKIFDGEDVVFAELLLNDSVGGEGEALVLDLSVTTLVDELADGFQVGLAVQEIENISEGTSNITTRTYPYVI